jgi:Family of unknown function (DUF6615)
MPTLCHTFRKEAGAVWNRMQTAAKLGLSLSEETLTECALYNVALAHQGNDIVIDLATKAAEAKHGADWEWWLVRGGKGLGFRVQAKRLFANGQYRALYKSLTNPYEQLDKLVSVSKSTGLEPIYCFYNFRHPQGQFKGPNWCKHPYRGPSFWGCSLAFPEEVKKLQSDQLAKLKQIMRPWHMLVCESANLDLLSAATNFVTTRGHRTDVTGPRELPNRVRRLVEMSDQRRTLDPEHRAAYLDDAFWQADSDTPDDVSGLIVVRDLRD